MGLPTPLHLVTTKYSGGIVESVPKESIGLLVPQDSIQRQRLSGQTTKHSDPLKAGFFFNLDLGEEDWKDGKRM